jgi:hypothetical protein
MQSITAREETVSSSKPFARETRSNSSAAPAETYRNISNPELSDARISFRRGLPDIPPHAHQIPRSRLAANTIANTDPLLRYHPHSKTALKSKTSSQTSNSGPRGNDKTYSCHSFYSGPGYRSVGRSHI